MDEIWSLLYQMEKKYATDEMKQFTYGHVHNYVI